MGIYLHTQGIYRQGSAYRGISTRDRRHRVQGCGIGSSNRAEVNTEIGLFKYNFSFIGFSIRSSFAKAENIFCLQSSKHKQKFNTIAKT